MKVVELRELSRREAPIHYIGEYTAVAVLESLGRKAEADIAFTLERRPVGPPAIRVRVLDPVDWPLLPVVSAIRDHLAELDRKGQLL